MAYNILGINPGHNGSVALVSDGKLVYFLEEERLSRVKYDSNPFAAMLDVIKKWHVDEIVIGGTHAQLPQLPWTGNDPYYEVVRKYFPDATYKHIGHEHHLTHAATGFYNSGFEKCLVVVVDGAGSLKVEQIDDNNSIEGYECETIFLCEHPNNFSVVYRSMAKNEGIRLSNGNVVFDNAVTITKAYEGVTQYLGFGFIEAGKTMGLASYGKKDSDLPEIFVNGRGNKNLFIPHYPAGSFIDIERYELFKKRKDPANWHRNPENLSEMEKNLAWEVQNKSQKLVSDLIKRAVEATGVNNVVIVGGYGLNCVANYYYKKVLPDINLYVEPVSNDAGTAIGMAMLIWNNRLDVEHDEPKRIDKIYYGPEYSHDEYKEILDNHSKRIKTKKVSYKDVAQMIADRNIVSIYQGRSEAGPRALGNRSILYDPRDPNGKDHVNTVKGREWFRPFAGTVLLEDADEWFDMAGLDESPFMMYAVNVVADKIDEIPAVCHVDDTCRVQTVTEEQNAHYYNLIKAFKDITGVPVLFNTSFNLAGDPLVESLGDALYTLYKSELRYLYLPELELLIEKTESIDC